MAIVVPDTLEVTILEFLLETADLKLKLFANPYEPSEKAVIASFTEVSGGGYAALDLLSTDWTIDSNGSATQSVKTFSFSGTTGGSGVVYGYYVTNVANTILYWAESLPSAVNPFTPSNTSVVSITPRFVVS